MKSTLKRFLSLVLCMCMVMALLPNVTMTAFAATSGTVTGLTDENIGLSFEGDADDAWPMVRALSAQLPARVEHAAIHPINPH